MIHLALLTEYSFGHALGKVEDVVARHAGEQALGIADVNGTYGHVPFWKECKKHNIRPIFGIRLAVVPRDSKQRTFNGPYTIFLAKNNEGIERINRLAKMAYDQHYYFPRLFDDQTGWPNVVTITPTRTPGIGTWDLIPIWVQSAAYNLPEDKAAFQVIAARASGITNFPQHLMGPDEAKSWGASEWAIKNTELIAQICVAQLAHADVVRFKDDMGQNDLYDICMFELDKRNLLQQDYIDRVVRECNLIREKEFEDYFYIVADMISKAKKTMMVGPSRGSSAGSLVCWLLGITEIDPMKYGLLFERFIDINRADLPDIDIDFPDDQRDQVLEYLAKKYGATNVQQLANINTYQPKSAINAFAMAYKIPKYETTAVTNAIIERSGGDARASMCLEDTLESTEAGTKFIEDYPHMALVSSIEGHASHVGKHAAAVIVSNKPLIKFGGINSYTGSMMMDKKMAESVGLLKIDCLGLRNLSILQDCAEMIGMDYHDYYHMEYDDQATFDLFNDGRLSGVFQFDGYALRSLTRQMGVKEFGDIVAITALARPGPLNSGGATLFAERRTGIKEVEYMSDDPLFKLHTEETLGVIIYQEQLMNLAREFGEMSWEDVSELRKAASKSLGEEFFNLYKDKFMIGTANRGIPVGEAEKVWKNMMTFGSWGFNKSHAVAYGMISYWTAFMKTHHPLEFAVASLNHAGSIGGAIKLLRDMVKNEDMEYVAVDPDLSEVKWSVQNGTLCGGLMNIVGIGEKKAQKIVDARNGKIKLTPGLFTKLESPVTEFDDIFPTQTNWGFIFTNPSSVGLIAPPVDIETIDETGDYLFIGRVKERNLRDLNEYNVRARRGGEIVTEDNLYLNLVLEDDTDSIICTVGRRNFERLGGKSLVESIQVDKTWLLVKGKVRDKWRRIDITHLLDLNKWRTENDNTVQA